MPRETTPPITVAPFKDGELAARAWAEWHLGDAAYGSDIVWAYLNPTEAQQQLEDMRNEKVV